MNADNRKNEWINVIERKYGICIARFKYTSDEEYIAYLYGMDGEVIGLRDINSGFPYGTIEVRLLNDKYKVEEILGEEFA